MSDMQSIWEQLSSVDTTMPGTKTLCKIITDLVKIIERNPISITKVESISLAPDDLVCLTLENSPPMQVVTNLRNMAKDLFPDNQTVILSGGISISVVEADKEGKA